MIPQTMKQSALNPDDSVMEGQTVTAEQISLFVLNEIKGFLVSTVIPVPPLLYLILTDVLPLRCDLTLISLGENPARWQNWIDLWNGGLQGASLYPNGVISRQPLQTLHDQFALSLLQNYLENACDIMTSFT